jgi:hypothetical protein
MKTILTFEAGDEWDDKNEIRKASNYGNAYLALWEIQQLILQTRDRAENGKVEKALTKLLEEASRILDNNSINLNNDVR